MKKVILLAFIFIPFLGEAQLEAYGRYTAGGSVAPNINFAASKKITDRISLTFFGLIEQKWSEALIGVAYASSESFTIGASVGIEHGTRSPRFGTSIWKVKGKTSLLILGELGNGKRNYLYKINLFQKYTERFTVGLTGWRFHGLGPNLQFTIPKLASTFWAMPAYDFEVHKPKLMIGITVKMKA